MKEKELIKSYQRKILTYVRKYPEIYQDDLMQEAYFGLVLASRRFNPKINKNFNTFAWCYIMGYVGHYLRTCTSTIRVPMRTEKQKEKLGNAVAYHFTSIEKIFEEDNKEYNPDAKYLVDLSVEDNEFDDELDFVKNTIQNYDIVFPSFNCKRDKDIIIQRFIKAKTLDAIAGNLNITRERVRHICKRASNEIKTLGIRKGILCS